MRHSGVYAACGIDAILTPHWLEQLGMALSDRQAQMGHGDVRMTLYYTHSDIARRRQSIEAMSDRLIGKRDRQLKDFDIK